MKKYINKIIITVGLIVMIFVPVKVNADVNYSYHQIQYNITSAPPANLPPVVNAGPDVSISLAFPPSSTNVSVTGNATDSDGVVSSMAWSVLSAPAGVPVNISPSSSTPNVTPASLLSNFSNLSVAGVYTFCLNATDDDAAPATPDCMNVTVTGGVVVSEDIDLTASAVSPTTATVGIATSFSSSISNLGIEDTNIGFSNFFQVAGSANGGGPIADLASSTMGVLAGYSSDISTSPNYTFFTVGTFSVRACADKFNSGSIPPVTIEETDENNNCGPWTNIIVSPPVLPVPTILFSAIDNPINSGQAAHLVWTTQDATSCQAISNPALGQWSNGSILPANYGAPGEPTGALTVQTNFGIRCDGPGGFANAYTIVYIIDEEDPLPPTISYFQPFSCVAGGSKFDSSPRFAWNSEHATSCTLSRITSPTLSEAVGISSEISGGSLEVDGLHYYQSSFPVVGNSSTYSLQCFNGTQNVLQYASVNVCSPDFTLSAAPILRSFVTGINPGTGNNGKIATYVISLNSIGGFGDDVVLSMQSYPPMPPSTSFTFTPSDTLTIGAGGTHTTATLTIGIDMSEFPIAMNNGFLKNMFLANAQDNDPGGGGGFAPTGPIVYTPIVIQGVGGGLTRTVTIGADATGKKVMKYREPNN